MPVEPYAMEEIKHRPDPRTPLPWGNAGWQIESLPTIKDYRVTPVTAVPGNDWATYWRANRNFILHACNHYPDLVKCLQAIVDQQPGYEDIIAWAKEALKECDEEVTRG